MGLQNDTLLGLHNDTLRGVILSVRCQPRRRSNACLCTSTVLRSAGKARRAFLRCDGALPEPSRPLLSAHLQPWFVPQWCTGHAPSASNNNVDYSPFYTNQACMDLYTAHMRVLLNRVNTGALQ